MCNIPVSEETWNTLTCEEQDELMYNQESEDLSNDESESQSNAALNTMDDSCNSKS